MNAPWLFAEAYKYRRLHEAFSVSKYWKDYDVFYRQKVSLPSRLPSFDNLTLNCSKSAIRSPAPLTLYSNSRSASSSLSNVVPVCPRKSIWRQSVSCSLSLHKVPPLYFFVPQIRLTIIIVCLWGNSTDLSLLINMSEEQIKSLQSTGGEHLAATEKNILGNHMGELWSTVKDLRVKTGGRIDFVLDNAGFELYCDMVYGTFTQKPPYIFCG